jgi:hypothetical protein
MEVNGQLDTPAALLLAEETQYQLNMTLKPVFHSG